MSLTREELSQAVIILYEACNEASEVKFAQCLAEDAVHYFPAGGVREILHGRDAIYQAWRDAIEEWDSRWTLDRLVVDEEMQSVCVEWTHFKPAPGGHVRGAEICEFDDQGLISEIRVYYAASVPDPSFAYELGLFDYGGRGYPQVPPRVAGRATRL